MAKASFVHDGKAIDYTPGSAVTAGDVIVQGSLVGIAKLDVTASALGALAITGVFDVAKAQEAFDTVGAKVYWDADGDPYGGEAGSGAVTATAGGNTMMGFVLVAAGETDSTVRVLLMSAPAAAEALGLANLSDVGTVTYTAGKLLVADGDSFEAVAAGGDVTIAANGAVTIGDDKVTTVKLLDGNVTAAKLADAVQDAVASLAVSAADNGDGTATLTVQAKDAGGNDLAANCLTRVWVGGADDFGVDAITGITISTGTSKEAVTANAEYLVVTDATGAAVLACNNGGAGSLYAWAEVGGRIAASGEIVITAA